MFSALHGLLVDAMWVSSPDVRPFLRKQPNKLILGLDN